MVKADPDEKLGGLELGELGWLDLRSMGIVERRGQALHQGFFSTHGFDQRL
jgi:hypothetical protein